MTLKFIRLQGLNTQHQHVTIIPDQSPREFNHTLQSMVKRNALTEFMELRVELSNDQKPPTVSDVPLSWYFSMREEHKC